MTIIPEFLSADGEREFLVVRQYRHGNERVGMEFPAGTVDPGEEPHNHGSQGTPGGNRLHGIGTRENRRRQPESSLHEQHNPHLPRPGSGKSRRSNLDENEYLNVHREVYSSILQHIGGDSYNSAISVQAWYLYLRHTGILK